MVSPSTDTLEFYRCPICRREYEVDCADIGTYRCECEPLPKIDLKTKDWQQFAKEFAAKYKRGVYGRNQDATPATNE